MNVVGRLARAELLRVRTTRTGPALVLATVLLALAAVAVTVGLGDRSDLRGQDGTRLVLAPAGAIAYTVAFVLGVLGMAGEWRHGTIGQTLLAAPTRRPLLAAKLVAYAGMGAVLGVVAFAATLALAIPWTSGRGADLELAGRLPWLMLLGSAGAAALFGMIGVGLGALLRNGPLALAIGLAWIVLVDTVVVSATSEVGRYLPGGAALSLLHGKTDADLLPMGQGALVLAGYAVVLALAGAEALTRRRSA